MPEKGQAKWPKSRRGLQLAIARASRDEFLNSAHSAPSGRG